MRHPTQNVTVSSGLVRGDKLSPLTSLQLDTRDKVEMGIEPNPNRTNSNCSVYSTLLSERRARMLPETLEKLMFLRYSM